MINKTYAIFSLVMTAGLSGPIYSSIEVSWPQELHFSECGLDPLVIHFLISKPKI